MSQSPTHLLVPIHVEALCVGNPEGNWVNLRPDFRDRSRFLGQKIERSIRSSISTLHASGVHLHWALPDGLTHGKERDNERGHTHLDFPHVPNRWLVVRLPNNSSQPKAWVVASDWISQGNPAQSWPSFHTDAAGTFYAPDQVGRSFALNDWQENPDAERVPLTALGYGDPIFAAHYPACKGVLGFHDPLDSIENVTLHYFVCGWYASVSDDPLHQAMRAAPAKDAPSILDAFLAEKKWTFPKLAEMLQSAQNATPPQEGMEALPTGILCHGIVTGIPWKNHDTTYQSTLAGLDPSKIKISLGETSVEAFAACLRAQAPDDQFSSLLQAFQYDLFRDLANPSGPDIFAQKVHEKRFRPLSPGIRWELLAQDNPGEGKAPPIPGHLHQLLEELNAEQRAINQLERERHALRSQLYATWYKRVLDRAGRDPLTQHISELQNQIDALSHEIAHRTADNHSSLRQQLLDQLQNLASLFTPDYELKPVEEPRFWRPNDPVMLLEGPALQRSLRHGEDGRYRNDGRLLCRLSWQRITEISISHLSRRFRAAAFFAGSDVLAQRIPQPEIADLIGESLLLTYTFIERGLAPGSTETSSRALDMLLQEAWKDASDANHKDPPLDGKATGVGKAKGVFPSPIMLNCWGRKSAWDETAEQYRKNPWIPLFLQWSVSWTPGYDDTSAALSHWKLDPSGTRFDWTGNDADKSADSCSYEGTTLLTPGATWTLSERLRQYSRTHNISELKTLATTVASMNLQGLSLSGLTDNLLMRKPCLELRPLEPASSNQAPRVSPILEQVENIDWLSPLTAEGLRLFPVRAGHLQINQLRIVDAFGQALDIDCQAPSPAAIHTPYTSSPLAQIPQPPRLSQPARLTIDWSPPVESGAAQGREQNSAWNPICGWILPNFFDAGLMIYDARGYALGALQLVRKNIWDLAIGGFQPHIEGFHWVGLPGNVNTDPLAPEEKSELSRFVNALLRQDGEAAEKFMASIEQSVSGTGNGSDKNPGLAFLTGKPLALVHAVLKLELNGPPAPAQGFEEPDKLAAQAREIEHLQIPVRLGDRRAWHDAWLGSDGLVGFLYPHDHDARFFHAYGCTGENDAFNIYGETPSLSIAAPLLLTLLMDTARGVSVTTGILPRHTFQLPFGNLAQTLEHKQVIFYTGPVVSPQPEDSDPSIHLPQPSDLYGQWSWTHHPEIEVWQELPIADTQLEQGNFSASPLVITEGWLQLITAPLAFRSFTAGTAPHARQENPKQAPVFEVQPGPVPLTWEVIGADRIELRRGDATLFASDQYPLPVQYMFHATTDTDFTLLATARRNPFPSGDKLSTDQPPQTIRKTIRIEVKKH